MKKNQLIVFIVILLTVLGLELGIPALSSADAILYLPLVRNNYSIPDNQAIMTRPGPIIQTIRTPATGVPPGA